LEPRRWKRNAHSSGNAALLETSKGNILYIYPMNCFEFSALFNGLSILQMHQDISTTQARACHFEEEARNLLSGLSGSVKCKQKLILMSVLINPPRNIWPKLFLLCVVCKYFQLVKQAGIAGRTWSSNPYIIYEPSNPNQHLVGYF
jgi:hypothetical protein